MSVERFLEIQDKDDNYFRALSELEAAEKQTHWIWYIFPQGPMANTSEMSQLYAIVDEQERDEFRKDEVLWHRYLDCVRIVRHWQSKGRTLLDILGSEVDVLKFEASVELFEV